MTEFREISSHRCTLTIWVAGDVAMIRQICAAHCFESGLCVTVTPTTFVYKGGAEDGAAIGLVNYPRFPQFQANIEDTAKDLALALAQHLNQLSVSIDGVDLTTWLTRRETVAGENG